VLLREYPSGRVLKSLGSHDMGATSVVFTPDGRKCLSGDRMGRLACHAVDTGVPVWTKHKSGRGGITGIDISSDGNLIVCCTDTGLLVVRDAGSGGEVRVFGDKGRGAVRCVAFMPGTRNFVSGSEDGTLRLWSAENGSETGVLKGHEGGVLCAAFGATGKVIVSGGRDNTVRMWDVQGSRCLMTLKEHSFSVYGVAVSPDGMLMASASWDHSVRIRDFKTGAARLNFVSDGGMFSCVKFHPSGRSVLAGCSDKAVHVVSLVEA
jgi:WD40 repeat protein